MNYQPGPTPTDVAALSAFMARELARISAALRDNGPSVHYATGVLTPAFTANNAKPNGIESANVLRISASVTQTLTGLALTQAWRELHLVNVGTGVVVLTSEDAASSASSRFALPLTLQLSANASVHLWYDAVSYRWRKIA